MIMTIIRGKGINNKLEYIEVQEYKIYGVNKSRIN